VERVNPEKAALLELFERTTKGLDGISTRKMFGFPCAFANEQMFMYVYFDDLVLRFSPEDRAACIEQTRALPFAPKGGRGMKEYLVIPHDIASNDAKLEPWVLKSLQYALSLPPKKARSR
jgi:TfoX/Sxy family transcriptional regulator of competence genes